MKKQQENQEKPFVLVLMPFDKKYGDVYTLGIEAACTEAGARCERVDKQKFDQNILQQIYDQIRRADIIVADMTGRNANVFYETGYAHALNKSVILLVKDVEDIPFDLQHYTHIVYGDSITELKKELGTWVTWYMEHPKEAPRREARMPLVKVSPSLVERQVNQIPKEWCSRSLYLGLTGAQNWLSIVNNPHQPYRADYFNDITARLLGEGFVNDISVQTMVSLGPGDGDTDSLLCAELCGRGEIEYVPVDINPFLLTTSVGKVGTRARTELGVVCDFEDELIPFLRDALKLHTRGPYLFSMLGFTLGNLDGRESRFFARMKELMADGDYLLFDYLAVGKGWDYGTYSGVWHADWDDDMRKFLCDPFARRRGEDSRELLSAFEKRFSFKLGKSDVPGSYATYIRDNKTGARVTNVRRYQGLGDWLKKTYKFEVVQETVNIEADHAGTGYILLKKSSGRP